MKRVLLLVLTMIMLASCTDTLDDQAERLNGFVSKNRYGSSADVWLVKNTSGLNERVSLIFGFVDDYSFCLDIAVLYMSKYRAESYTCEIAN